MSHGIGRSGDIMDLQPKAPGLSLLNRLTQYLIKDMLKHIGMKVKRNRNVTKFVPKHNLSQYTCKLGQLPSWFV